MNLAKSEVKIALGESWAKRFSDLARGSEIAAFKFQGGMETLKQCRATLESIKSRYDADLENGVISAEECASAKKVVDRCQGGLQAVFEHCQAQMNVKAAEVNAYSKAADLHSKDVTDEATKVKHMIEAIDQGTVVPEKDGSVRVLSSSGKPGKRGSADLARRRAEAKAKWDAREAEGNGSKPPKKKRTPRKKKAEPKEAPPVTN